MADDNDLGIERKLAVEGDEVAALIAQVRKTVAAMKAARAKGSALGHEERAALRVDQQTTVAMLRLFVEHRPQMADAQVEEIASVVRELQELAEQTGQPEQPVCGR